MRNSQVTTPLIHSPMPQQQFDHCCVGQLQEQILYRPELQVELLRHQWAMQKEANKSQLRQQEYAMKQKGKQLTVQITEASNGIMFGVINGNREILRQIRAFSCRIIGVNRFQRRGFSAHFWQLELEVGNEKVVSELYLDETLQSLCKLRRTVMGQYEFDLSEGDSKTIWNWVRKRLSQLYEHAPIIELPSLAGWFLANGRWCFWDKESSPSLLASEVILRFRRKAFSDLERKKLVSELLINKSNFGSEANLGIFLIFRFSPLLVRFIKTSSTPMSLTLVGERALEIAMAYCRTMEGVDGSFDIVNIDTDRIESIRKKLSELQDTPLIFVSAYPENRSTQNRLTKVSSWIETGIVEGIEVTVPFIFCFRECSPLVEFNGSIVVTTEEIRSLKEADIFDQIQYFLTGIIENSGTYWSDELRKLYDKKSQEISGKENLMLLGEVIMDFILQILEPDGKEKKALQKVFEQGIQEMKTQLSLHTGILPEIFRRYVGDLCDKGQVVVLDKHAGEIKGDVPTIYFDQHCYYFSKNVLEYIGETVHFSKRTLLEVKKELAARNMARQYRARGQRPSELEIDIFLGDHAAEKKLSVFAVKREFWDEPGEIALWERGECNALALSE